MTSAAACTIMVPFNAMAVVTIHVALAVITQFPMTSTYSTAAYMCNMIVGWEEFVLSQYTMYILCSLFRASLTATRSELSRAVRFFGWEE